MTKPTAPYHLAVEGVIDSLIGRRLREAREEQNMTIEELETLTGYSAEELGYYESAELCIPVQRAIRLSHLLDAALIGPFQAVHGAFAIRPKD